MAKSYTNTSSNTSVTTDQVGFENIDGTALAAGGDLSHNITITDGGIVSEAISLVENFGQVMQTSQTDFLKAASSLNDNLFKSVDKTLATVLDKNQQSIISGIVTAQQPDTAAMKELIKLIGLGGLLALVLVRWK